MYTVHSTGHAVSLKYYRIGIINGGKKTKILAKKCTRNDTMAGQHVVQREQSGTCISSRPPAEIFSSKSGIFFIYKIPLHFIAAVSFLFIWKLKPTTSPQRDTAGRTRGQTEATLRTAARETKPPKGVIQDFTAFHNRRGFYTCSVRKR